MEIHKDKLNFKIVIWSLALLVLFAVYLFGLRVFVVLGANIIAALFTEFVFQRKKAQKISKEILITAMIFTLILPPKIPLELSIYGMIFGVLFGKCVYGGYGYNIFNPALVGRVFLHASFAKEMTAVWTRPVAGTLGGYGDYLGKTVSAVSRATPILSYKWSGEEPNLFKLAFGFTEGCIGETSAVIIGLIGVVLLYKKIISKEIVFSILLTYLLLNYITYEFVDDNIINPVYGVLSGGLFFGTVFMANDPVTSPVTKGGKIIYGVTIGIITFFIRTYSLFTGGIMFAILIGNMITPVLDIYVKAFEKSKDLDVRRRVKDV